MLKFFLNFPLLVCFIFFSATGFSNTEEQKKKKQPGYTLMAGLLSVLPNTTASQGQNDFNNSSCKTSIVQILDKCNRNPDSEHPGWLSWEYLEHLGCGTRHLLDCATNICHTAYKLVGNQNWFSKGIYNSGQGFCQGVVQTLNAGNKSTFIDSPTNISSSTYASTLNNSWTPSLNETTSLFDKAPDNYEESYSQLQLAGLFAAGVVSHYIAQNLWDVCHGNEARVISTVKPCYDALNACFDSKQKISLIDDNDTLELVRSE